MKMGLRPYTSDSAPVTGLDRNCNRENSDPSRPIWKNQNIMIGQLIGFVKRNMKKLIVYISASRPNKKRKPA